MIQLGNGYMHTHNKIINISVCIAKTHINLIGVFAMRSVVLHVEREDSDQAQLTSRLI